MDQLILFVNGKKVVVQNPDPEITLLQFIRTEYLYQYWVAEKDAATAEFATQTTGPKYKTTAIMGCGLFDPNIMMLYPFAFEIPDSFIKVQLKGTKLGCGEGGCGACTVMVTRYDYNDKTFKHMSVNACLAPLCSLHGLAVTTVEGLGNVKNGLHPVQERLAKSHGSQCGFCTPGIVMSMYALLCNDPHPSESSMEKAFEGNLCRCTGYRPILEGFRTFTQPDSKKRQNGKSQNCSTDNARCNGEQCTNGGKCCKQNGPLDKQQNGTLDKQQNDSKKLFSTQEFVPFNPAVHLAQPIKELEVIAEECDKQSLVFKSDRVTWHRPTSLKDLIGLKDKHPNAKIVIGNTEIGVEVKFKSMHYPVIIAATNIHELNSVQHMETGIRVGASVTLAKLEDVLNEAINQREEYETRIFAAIIEMLRWFAGPQVRNVAAVGGNIVTASPISDLNPLFLSAGCTLMVESVCGRRSLKMDHEFFVGYRKTKIKPNEVLLFVDIPFTKENEYFWGYKQSQRREDDIAIVNAGMRVLFEKGSTVIKDIALSYGGMAPFTVMATKTAKQLKGRKWEDDLIPVATQLLADELPLAPGTPGGMEAYRCSLTMSFFYKFYLTVRCSLQQKLPKLLEAPLPETCLSATRLYHREASHGVQVFEDAPQGQIKVDAVGRPLPHMSALKQVTGEALFVDDMPVSKGEYYLSLVVSTKAHAKILSVDPSEALHMPGVVDYVSWKDIPAQNKAGTIISDEKVFAVDLVTSQGMVIGAVLADNQVHAQRAAKAVKVEYEELKPIITIEEAIAAGSYLTPPKTVQSGDVVAAMSKAERVLEGEVRMGGQEHFYLETQATLVVPKDGDGEMEIFCSCQDPAYIQRAVATVLGIDCNKIVSRVKRLGGGFGGKESRFALLAIPVAVAAYKHNRAVRCMLDRDEDMVITGTRHPYLVKYKVGVTSHGKIQALEVDFYQNSGYSLDLSMTVMDKSLLHIDNAYKIPHIRVTGHLCRTNTPSNTAFRGFGAPQAMFACETIIDRIAKTLEICPMKVRELNMYKEGDVTFYNETLVNFTLPRCWNDVIKQSDYENRRRQVEDFNSKNRWLKRGISVIPVKYGLSFGFLALNKGSALVHIYLDGSVLLSFGSVEMGQGLNTKMIQVASRVLKIPTSKIYVSECSSSHVANASPTAASFGSDLNGMAVMKACESLMERLQPYITSSPEGPWETWINSAYMDRICLSSTGFYVFPGLDYNWETNTGSYFAYYCMGAACSEVEIDCLTGDHTVLRTDIVMDVGKSLNPAIDIGQIEGAFTQGYGLFTIEEQKYSPTGYLYNRGPGAYKIPSFSNIPIEFNVTLLKDAPNPKAVYSSKGIGEPPLCLSLSVFFAIKEAIQAERKEAGLDGSFRLDSPATAERIRMACVDDFTKRHPDPTPGTFTPWIVRL